MKNLKISQDTALSLYPTASPEFKKMLEETFGVEFFKPKTLFDIIKTYSDVCKQLCEPEETCPYRQLKQIERLFNGNWRKDWSNSRQNKYYPYFQYKAGVGLAFSGSCYDVSCCSGQAAYFKDREVSDFVGKIFVDIYRKL